MARPAGESAPRNTPGSRVSKAAHAIGAPKGNPAAAVSNAAKAIHGFTAQHDALVQRVHNAIPGAPGGGVPIPPQPTE